MAAMFGWVQGREGLGFHADLGGDRTRVEAGAKGKSQTCVDYTK